MTSGYHPRTSNVFHHAQADYLRSLDSSAVKLEYCDGVIARWRVAPSLNRSSARP
jgi:hypothetical protein